ncbi:helix-turn-helix domain-containing protein [Rhodococcus sp. Q]|uniref:helix-turn-helix domain-containing protein n=1 Tax=Rhodococcus sp. Q TaxID=2502252 RepID=UPI0010F48359|nr:helix-turn-helix domain-containing protein [Rhodococcus sp. Q]
MTIVFDTAQFDAGDRADATCTAMQENSAPSTVVLEDPAAVTSLMEVWTYGDASIFRSRMSGMGLVRTGKQADRTPSPLIAIAVQEVATARYEQRGVQRLVAPGELMVVDLNAGYDYSWDTFGSSRCLHVPLDRLDLPSDVIRSASAHPERSPVARMLARHISTLTVEGDALSAGPGSAALGEAAIDLARALFATASGGEHGRAAMNDALTTRIRSHVRAHLFDRTLSAETVASAHGISTRHLYTLCAAAGFSLEQWIIEQRLRRAYEELSTPRAAAVPIATIARRFGFAGHAHFTRRFRAAYGVTPSQWRDTAAAAREPDE